ncbi:MAG TPA: GNAT family N-acetyltransferase [Actinocrinis sp.]|uniref:GNAT family N-acetyltransferase n=1 Tax=Actinocrinis sp. TaxID=1920516 RepID=UPI002DDD80DD|nr:GNAT family N-acetyltransferase [Actinocrinis sp.]HEV2346291.1 GNAT family N-acetyltransferase [Actinocrinis sp.]
MESSDHSGWEVRRVRADEWRALRDIRLEALKDTPIGFGERYEDALAKPDDDWRERARRDAEAAHTALFAAFDPSGRIVGTTGTFTKADSVLTDGRELVIYGVYVTPGQRGARRGVDRHSVDQPGVASLLFDAAIAWAREAGGADVITLSVHERNERAHAFYRRYGFADTGVRTPYNLDETALLIEMRFEG